MKTKICPCGNLLEYLGGTHDWSRKPREDDPVALRGSPALAAAALDALAPFELNHRSRRAWFYPRRCTHLVAAFSEPRAVVDSLVRDAILDLERAVGVGLPEDALYWVWYYHPQEVCGHSHGGLLHFAFPDGGSYAPELGSPEAREMLRLLDHLWNRKHGLTSDMEPHRARLFRPARCSFKDQFLPWVQQIQEAAEAAWHAGELTGNTVFIRLLPPLGLQPLAWQDAYGAVRWYPAAMKLGFAQVNTYRDSLTVLTPAGTQLVLRGPVLRPEFSPGFWQAELERRRSFQRDLHQHPEKFVLRFRELLDHRAQRQRARHPRAGWLGRPVGADDLDCVVQPPPKTILSMGL